MVYAIKCEVNGMIYIGSTLIHGRRFDNHLVSGKYSNPALQPDLQQYGLDNFTVYVLELVKFPADLKYKRLKKHSTKSRTEAY